MGSSAGRRSSHFERIKAELRSARGPCYLCGQPIDYTQSYPHPESFTVDHVKSWINHPELRDDPANCRAAHARCNAVKGKGDAPVSLGVRSEDW